MSQRKRIIYVGHTYVLRLQNVGGAGSRLRAPYIAIYI